MTRTLPTLGLGLLLVVAGAAFVPSARIFAGDLPSDPLTFAGSFHGPILNQLAEAFRRIHPPIKIDILPLILGTSGGIRAAADGAIAVGLTSRPLTDRERPWGLTVLPYARTAVVVAAHPSVADDEITFAELVSMYRGTKTRWKDGHEIMVLTLDPDHSTLEVLLREIPGFQEAYAESQRAKRWVTLTLSARMHLSLEKNPYAIGLTEMPAIAMGHLRIKVLKVNGVLPTPENILSGSYPLVKTLAFVFRQDTLPAEAKAFLDFVRSRAAEPILRASGYLPGE